MSLRPFVQVRAMWQWFARGMRQFVRYPKGLSEPNGISKATPDFADLFGTSELPLTAYCTSGSGPHIEPAAIQRKWMDDTAVGFANRCLPLRIANQAGWFILNEQKLEVTWNGGDALSDVVIRYFENMPARSPYVVSHFGSGIVTWRIPYLFRTPNGYNLYVRGPANWCKDGACPLDGIVETDWAVATFTMNWKITRPRTPILFDKGEPICMIFPFPRGTLERFSPEIRDIGHKPELERKYQEWAKSRLAFNEDLRDSTQHLWQKDYYTGRTTSGEEFANHQIKLHIRKFKTST